eukprot:GEMP01024546.1.p1 GENE.GEMP01024546.1~~GEMP01024546.1.p1  ORF type:complete len:430 (+),score=90.42 GEMP01024546.1:101-1390(+)
MPEPTVAGCVAAFLQDSKDFPALLGKVFAEFATDGVIEKQNLRSAYSSLFSSMQVNLSDTELDTLCNDTTDGARKNDFTDCACRILQGRISSELSALRRRRSEMLDDCANVVTSARRSSNASSTAKQREDFPALDRFPNLKDEKRALLLDIGSGELGFYVYERADDGAVLLKNDKKVPCSFLEQCLDSNDLEKFASLVLEHYGTLDEAVYAGLTGINRERYLTNREPFDLFFEAVTEKIPKIQWFIPSAKQEAELELTAVQYLAAKCGFGEIDGVLSAGGGSCQISCRNNFYLIPVGSKTYDKIQLFGATLQEKVYSWMITVSNELHKTRLKPLSGVFVGISGMFYAAKAAGITGKTITKEEALTQIDEALAKALGADDQRNVYNLAMVRVLLLSALTDDAKVFFQRNWKVGEDEMVATWTLGLFSGAV